MFKICDDLNLLKCYSTLNQQLIKYHHFFSLTPNRENSYVTWIDGKPYIMLKLSNVLKEKISVYDIKPDLYITINNDISMLNHFPWIELWQNKIDYFEEYFFVKQNSYKKMFPIFHYFIGIAENALLYLKETEIESKKEFSDNLVVSHVRITVYDDLYDYYDLTNVIIDHPSRDISEYIKSAFVNKVWDLDILKGYLEKNKFSDYGVRTLLARIMFPSFFFDYLENLINNDEKLDLLYIETRAEEFKKFIREVCIFLSEKYKISTIPWIIKET